MGNTFSVAAMVHEDKETIRIFCDYYLSLGVKEIFLYLDDCDFLSDDPRVIVTDWTDSQKEKLLKTKQVEAYKDAFQRATSNWILIIDVDEFLLPGGDLKNFLRAIPEEVNVLRLPTAEAVWGPDDDINKAYDCSYFRTKIGDGGIGTKIITSLVYGPEFIRYFRKGLAGHTGGKSLLRVGSDVGMIRLHAPWKDGTRQGTWAYSVGLNKAYIAHFDAISFDRWCKKWKRRLSKKAITLDTAGRNRQSDDLSIARFRKFYSLNKFQVTALRAIGKVFTMRRLLDNRFGQ
jgi:hypothetical protein